MKRAMTATFLSLGLLLFSCLTAQAAQDHDQEEAYVRQKIVIVGSFKDYAQALRAAKGISAKTAVPFSTRGMVYDKKEGLVWPESIKDEIYAGTYMARRYDDECDQGQTSCITIEKSRFYEGMQHGYYILVGGIFSADNPEAERVLRSFQNIVPSAYAKTSNVYMGCLH